jgi:hypothetical protein
LAIKFSQNIGNELIKEYESVGCQAAGAMSELKAIVGNVDGKYGDFKDVKTFKLAEF